MEGAIPLFCYIPHGMDKENIPLSKNYLVVCFLLGNSPASEFYTPTFRNTLHHLHRQVGAYLTVPSS